MNSVFQNNKEFLERKQRIVYKIGETVGMLFYVLVKGNFEGFLGILKSKCTSLRIRLFTTGKTRYPQKKTEYKNERIAVYTVLFGNIDRILEPKVIDPHCDYYIITDQMVPTNSQWKKMDIDMSPVRGFNNRTKNRYYKMHASDLFAEYRYSIYIDANIIIYGELSDLIQYVNPESGIGVHNMPNRGGIFEEIYARMLIDPRDKAILERQRNDYISNNYNDNQGMFECNVLVMSNCSKCREIMNRWWEEYRKYPARDQVSFPYILWELGVPQDKIGIIGNSMRLNPYFRIIEHSTRRV